MKKLFLSNLLKYLNLHFCLKFSSYLLKYINIRQFQRGSDLPCWWIQQTCVPKPSHRNKTSAKTLSRRLVGTSTMLGSYSRRRSKELVKTDLWRTLSVTPMTNRVLPTCRNEEFKWDRQRHNPRLMFGIYVVQWIVLSIIR